MDVQYPKDQAEGQSSICLCLCHSKGMALVLDNAMGGEGKRQTIFQGRLWTLKAYRAASAFSSPSAPFQLVRWSAEAKWNRRPNLQAVPPIPDHPCRPQRR